ncbi:MAG: hypothetical protein IJM75_07225 [Ruminococcus sp.]|nr:hypothetical protein [Ruminococcus sp.]
MPKTAVEVKELFIGLKEGIAEKTTAQLDLRTAMTVLIYHCNRYDHIDNGLEVNEEDYDDEFELDEEKKKKKAEIAAIYIERIKLLNEIAEKANALGDDPDANKVKKTVKELSEEYLKELSAYETEKENEAIDKDYDNFSVYEKKAYTKLKNEGLRTISGKYGNNGGINEEVYFEQQKSLLADLAAKSIALHTLGRTYRSMLHADETMTDNEKDQLAKDFFGKDGTKVFEEKGIKSQIDEIKNSANFKQMMSEVNDWDEFMNLKDEASYANNFIIDRLAKATKTVLESENPKPEVQQPNKIVKTNNIKL